MQSKVQNYLKNACFIIKQHIKCLKSYKMRVVKQPEKQTQPTLISLHPNEYSQELHYYPFAINLGRCAGSCNTLNDLSNKVCFANETEYLNLRVFNMLTGINESKILTKHISCKCKCKFNGRKCNSNQKFNNDKC